MIAAGLEQAGSTEILAAAGNFGYDLSGCERIGFVYPVYFGGVPLAVKNLVESLDIPADCYLFAVATLGGNAKNGLTEMNALLSPKGRELDFGATLTMGGNYILIYGKLFNADFANVRASKSLPKIAAAVRDKAKRPAAFPKPGWTESAEHFREKVRETALSYNVSDDCISCGLCAEICPVRNICPDEKTGNPVFGAKCEQCMACIQFCPQKAINYKDKTQKRKRYHHPAVTAEDFKQLIVNNE